MHEDIICDACGCSRWTDEEKDEHNTIWLICECGFERELLSSEQEYLTIEAIEND